MKRNVIIALMTYSGQPMVAVKNCCFAAISEMARTRGWDGAIMDMEGDAMLPRARNAAVSRFLAFPGSTDLIFIDDDNYPTNPSDLVRLVDHEVDCVAAPCRAKTNDVQKWPVRWKHETVAKADNGLIDVAGVGTGILRLTRACLEKMCEAWSARWYEDPNSPTGKSIELFGYSIENNTWWGEDMLFCARWTEIGGKVWVDPDIKTEHIGKFAFSGSVGEWLRTMPGEWNLHSPEVNKRSKVVNTLSAQFDAVREAAE